tara:strand:+ start:6212 stop:6616 length:405 start_codon:yes stop_codon:yes gene_type:complete
MPVENILSRLDKVSPSGQQKWRCACPVHGGTNKNMMISERSDGSVGVHCFVCGATGVQLMETLGLKLSEIFAPDSDYVRPAVTAKMNNQLMEDEMVLMISKAAEEDGIKLSLEDKRRVRLARHRSSRIEELKNN